MFEDSPSTFTLSLFTAFGWLVFLTGNLLQKLASLLQNTFQNGGWSKHSELYFLHFWEDYLTKPLINTTIEYRRPSLSCQTSNIDYTTDTFAIPWDTVV